MVTLKNSDLAWWGSYFGLLFFLAIVLPGDLGLLVILLVAIVTGFLFPIVYHE